MSVSRFRTPAYLKDKGVVGLVAILELPTVRLLQHLGKFVHSKDKEDPTGSLVPTIDQKSEIVHAFFLCIQYDIGEWGM